MTVGSPFFLVRQQFLQLGLAGIVNIGMTVLATWLFGVLFVNGNEEQVIRGRFMAHGAGFNTDLIYLHMVGRIRGGIMTLDAIGLGCE